MIASTQTNHPLAGVSPRESAPTGLNEACKRLRDASLRITKPRIAILTALIHRGQPTSIEQIHADLAEGSCDLVTVYRCLAAFEEIGLVRRSFFHNGTSLYQIGLGENSRYHVVSRNTNTVEEIDAESAEELRATVQRIEERLRARGYTDITHVVEFFSTKPTTDRIQESVEVR